MIALVASLASSPSSSSSWCGPTAVARDPSTTPRSPPTRSSAVDVPLVVPELPDGWTANRAELVTASAPTASHSGTSGFITPSTQYIGLVQGIDANATWVSDADSRAPRSTGTRHASAASDWQVYDHRDVDDPGNLAYALVDRPSGDSTVVLGGTATDAEFATLAADGRRQRELATVTEHAPRPRSGARWCAATSASSPASRCIPGKTSSAATKLAAAQAPHAALFGCSDSRLAAEIIFDKGLGDLFVVRNAGQVISDSVIGSLEYAVAVLDVPLIVVLGHDECGAVRAAIDSGRGRMRRAAAARTSRSLIAPIAPAVRACRRGIDGDARRRSRSAASTCATPSPSCSSAPSSSATRSPRVRWQSSARTTGCARAGSFPTSSSARSDSPDRISHVKGTRRREQRTRTEFRIEHDTMGEVRVPATALYGAQTQRAVENFPISGSGLEPAQIVALARIKRAAALVNKELGIVDGAIADAIVAAADELIAGEHHDQFPVDTYQTGSGTCSNMNMNEVLATLATTKLGSPVHPNDHVNASQSSNDVFPTSVHVAVTGALHQRPHPRARPPRGRRSRRRPSCGRAP